MIIGKTFAWGHVPKTGGDATLARFRLFPELILHADASDTNDKHHPFHFRPEQTEGKQLVLNIRRLPAWNLSHALHEARAGLYPDYRPLPLATAEEIAERSLADHVLGDFTNLGRVSIDRWLRMEHLDEDVLAFVGELADVSEARRSAVLAIGSVNAYQYNRDFWRWFTPQQVARMYEHNPVWASIERRVYGGTLRDSIAEGACRGAHVESSGASSGRSDESSVGRCSPQ